MNYPFKDHAMFFQMRGKLFPQNKTCTVALSWQTLAIHQLWASQCTQLCFNAQPETTSPRFSSPSVHNPSLQPSLYFTTSPGYIRLPKLLFSSGTRCCVRKLREQRVGHLSPYIASGHPRNASSLWVWAAANHVASQCHRGTETEKRWSTLFHFYFPPRRTKGCILLHFGSTS